MGLVAAAITIAVVLLVLVQLRRERGRELAGIASLLERPIQGFFGAKLSGSHRGHAVVYRLETSSSRMHKRLWTELDVATPRLPFRLSLREETEGERDLVRRGLALDLQIGDREFDARFIVEAAPSDVMKKLLDAELRRGLMAVMPSVYSTDGGLRFHVRGHVKETARAAALLDVATRLAGGIRAAFEAADADAEAAAPRVGGPFRAEPDASQVAAGKEARDRELAELARVEARHGRWLLVRLGLGLLAIGLVTAGLFYLNSLMHR